MRLVIIYCVENIDYYCEDLSFIQFFSSYFFASTISGFDLVYAHLYFIYYLQLQLNFLIVVYDIFIDGSLASINYFLIFPI